MTIPAVPNQPHALYRFFDSEGQLLYVGLTMNPGARWKVHSREKSWWTDVRTVTLEWFPDREAVEVAERAAIATEGPLYNVSHQPPKPQPVRVVVTEYPLAAHLNDGKWPSVSEAVELLRPLRNSINRNSIYRWIHKGKIGYRRGVGGRLALDPDDVVKLIKLCRTVEVSGSPTTLING